jgi:predicted dehydrogenase
MRWAILGPGAISRDFAAGLRASRHGALHAVGSSSPDRAAAFAAEHGAAVSGSYDDVLAREDVDLVYIGTVHSTHAELAIRALEAGKAVLCEKPASPSTSELVEVLDAASRAGLPFLEAYKSRFGPLSAALDALVRERRLGAPTHVVAAYGFAAGTRSGRLFDPALAGGAILDVGCYPVALAVQIAAASGQGIDAPELVARDHRNVAGVDGEATAELRFDQLRVDLGASIVRDLPRSAVIRFEEGEALLPDAWGGRASSAASVIVRERGTERRVDVPVVQPMAAEADALAVAAAEGRLEAPEVPWAHSLAIARVLTAWRSASEGDPSARLG